MSHKESVRLQDQVFAMKFDAYSCFAIHSGRCSLDYTDEELAQWCENHQKVKVGYSAKSNYCRDLLQALRNGTCTKDFIEMKKSRCGHITFTDGQHRICASIMLNKAIDIEVYISDEEMCDFCKGDSSMVLVNGTTHKMQFNSVKRESKILANFIKHITF